MNYRRNSYFSTLLSLWLCAVLTHAYSALGSGTVTNCTQHDLEAALAGGGTVLFACSGTVSLTNTITISTDTLIDANGYAVAVSGNSSVRLFLVTSNVNFQVNGLTLANGQIVGTSGANGDPPSPGQNVYGAGILNQGGTLILLNCTLTNHYVLGGKAGTNSTSGTAKGGDGLGASIYSAGGIVNLTNCTLAGNAAIGGLGSPPSAPPGLAGDGGQAIGGAIYLLDATGNLQNVTLLNNSATGGAAQSIGTASGGGTAAGGAFYATNSMVFIGGSVVESNSATGGGLITYGPNPSSSGLGSGSGKGGGLFLSQGSSANIRLSSFTGNSAIGGGGGRFQAAGVALGGAVFSGGQLQISDSSFSSNQSRGGGRSVIPGAGKGGAIYSTNTLIVTGCTLDSNLAVGGSASGETGITWPGAAGEGGALWSSGALAVTNSTCNANAATGGTGGGGTGSGAGGAGSGGALDVTGGTAFLVNVTIAGNRTDGGAFPSNPPGPAQGGAVCNTNGALTGRNSIFASSANGGDVWGVITDTGHNICSDSTANFSAVGSLNNTDPQLSPLGNNGGPTATMALLVASPARDALSAGFPTTDQRGVLRPQGLAADIGAFEAAVISAPPMLTYLRSGNNLTISFTAPAGGTYRLLSSTDLKTWFPVATNSTLTAGSLQFIQPINVAPRNFYRVVAQ